MRYSLCLVALSLTALIGAQEPSPWDRDPDGHLHSEHQIPAGDYCKRPDVRISPREIHAHHCDCTYACSVDENGDVHEFGGEKQPKCMSYCSKDGRRCTCHVEEPCDLKNAPALADMNGKVIAERKR